MFMQRHREAEIVEKEILSQFPKVETVKFNGGTSELRFTTTKDVYVVDVLNKLQLRVGPVEVYIFRYSAPYEHQYCMTVHNTGDQYHHPYDFVCHPHVYYGQACFNKVDLSSAMRSENYDAAVDIALRFLQTSGTAIYWSLETLAEKFPDRVRVVEWIPIEHKRGRS